MMPAGFGPKLERVAPIIDAVAKTFGTAEHAEPRKPHREAAFLAINMANVAGEVACLGGRAVVAALRPIATIGSNS